MKLHYNPASPYVRKARVVAIETGLMDDIELAKVTTTPVGPDADLCADNPIGKIPTLVRDDGGALFDSRPTLAAWFEKFGARSSMGETRPE